MHKIQRSVRPLVSTSTLPRPLGIETSFPPSWLATWLYNIEVHTQVEDSRVRRQVGMILAAFYRYLWKHVYMH